MEQITRAFWILEECESITGKPGVKYETAAKVFGKKLTRDVFDNRCRWGADKNFYLEPDGKTFEYLYITGFYMLFRYYMYEMEQKAAEKILNRAIQQDTHRGLRLVSGG